MVLAAVRRARIEPAARSARVLPAHLESNFINPEFAGAQPLACLRFPPASRRAGSGDYNAADLLAEFARARPDVGIITLAPELDGALPLVRDLVRDGHRVSLGHSGATYEEAIAAVAAGARHATHLFNRMPPLGHRQPGLAGAVLHSDELAAEIICDGRHVHPAMLRLAVAAKTPARVMAITDGTAGAGLPPGSRATLGRRTITVRDAAYLDDGTLAGSVLTMDQAFRTLVTAVGLSPVDAATLCSTTPAREMGLQGHGVLAPGSVADMTVLDRSFQVVRTYVGGRLAYAHGTRRVAGPSTSDR
jgi:N-acetylglucosamine-6-phosphate deacetylase